MVDWWIEALPDGVQALATLMSDLSEAGFCSGWMDGLEVDLWRLAHADVDRSTRYGMDDVTPRQKADLRALAEACGCWVVWSDERVDDVGFDGEWISSELGLVAMPLAEWRARVAPVLAAFPEACA